jgi:hypothetical protein
MKMNGKILLIFFLIIILAGFYLLLDNIRSLRNDVKNLELAIEILKRNQETADNKKTEISAEPTTTPAITPQTENTITIPTSIIFETQSSPALEPRTKITITIESVTKTKDGRVTLNIKAYTNEATSYSAIEIRDLFQLVNLSGEDQKPLEINGSFQSMPPKSSVSGNAVFKIEPNQNSIILQVGPLENASFYEFNFLQKTYKETILGQQKLTPIFL